jgi:histidinol-phosphate/aromatic aminotransferase/cobyric acid decarboxylase-like protein
LRSLTKFYALPGLRAGCLVADRASIASLAAAREPWTVNVLAEQAAATALSDCAYQQRTVRLVGRERAWCWNELRRLPGLDPVPSSANFFLVHCTRPVAFLETFLLRHRILIRDCTGLEGIRGPAFRFAVRRRPENARFLARLKEFLC